MPRLQKALSPIATSLLLGTLWAGWHYWIFLIPGQFKNDIPFGIFVLSCIADTLCFTWLHNQSGFSILAGMLFHFSYNLTYHIVPVNPVYYSGDTGPYLVMIISELAIGIILNLQFSTKVQSTKRRSKAPLYESRGRL